MPSAHPVREPGGEYDHLPQACEDLEKLASNFEGVEKAFALQAGRELRVFVRPDHLDDEECFSLARKIASQIENELQYPGQIKVTVIRETRCVEVAK